MIERAVRRVLFVLGILAWCLQPVATQAGELSLEQAQRERGRNEDAAQTMERLREEFPELAAKVESGG